MAHPPKKGSPAMCAKRPASCLAYDPANNDPEEGEGLGVAAFVIDVEHQARKWKCQSCLRSDASAHPSNN
eukprot:8809425-Alexandrium_andersonii.AAC.1